MFCSYGCDFVVIQVIKGIRYEASYIHLHDYIELTTAQQRVCWQYTCTKAYSHTPRYELRAFRKKVRIAKSSWHEVRLYMLAIRLYRPIGKVFIENANSLPKLLAIAKLIGN